MEGTALGWIDTHLQIRFLAALARTRAGNRLFGLLLSGLTFVWSVVCLSDCG